jgi:hypothetical protein
VIPVGGGDLTRACGLFFDAVAEGHIQIRTDGRLDQAVAAAKRRPSGDAWVWARKTSSADISPLVAVTVAYWQQAQGHGGPSAYVSLSEVQ